MASPLGDRAIADAQRVGKAVLKFISPNDAGLTAGHQYGFLLPVSGWKLFTSHGPVKGENPKSAVRVTWQNGRETQSTVTWYGKAKSEYRLTGFGRDFPFRTADNVGDMLVLIPESHQHFLCYVLDLEEDIQDIQAALGVEVIESSAIYDRDAQPTIETEDECIQRELRTVVNAMDDFPQTEIFSAHARRAVANCIKALNTKTADERLMLWHDTEYVLFQMAERKICAPEIGGRIFRSVDEFLATASRIMNRRKSRAGWSLENQVNQLLTDAQIPHDMRVSDIGGRPDIIIPGRAQYLDSNYPPQKLLMVGVKTTCKDRWRQVLREAPRVPVKHIITIQQGISATQLHEMARSNVKLVVPKRFHKHYPPGSGVPLMDMEQFLGSIKACLA